MRDDDRRDDELRDDDRAFLDAVRDAYRPEPTNAAAFDRALRQRLAGGTRRSIFAWGGGLALAATAAAALIIGLRATETPPERPARPDAATAVSLSEVVAAPDEAVEALEANDDAPEASDDVFLALTVLEDAPEDDVEFADDTLPDDYLALSDLLDVTL